MANQEIVTARIEDASSPASISASTSYHPCYDVFINHRGRDVKDTFASDLYRRLRGLGLKVFLDRDELVKGQRFPPQIEAAINASSVHVAIFSPTYARSEWCLKELVFMLKSRGTILPVFHNVEPSILRRTNGEYFEALQSLQEKRTHDLLTGETKLQYDADTIKSWRDALSDAADITGFVLRGHEGKFLEEVVQSVLEKVPKTPLDLAKYPVGSIYDVKGLNRPISKQLFCSSAFCQRPLLPEFADLIDSFSAACDGLPLSLKAEILGRLHERIPKEIHVTLRMRYDSLNEEDHTIFLDIVCFFIGEDMDRCRTIWGKGGLRNLEVGLRNLENMCLLEVDNENKIKVHDQIRDMGRAIASEPYKSLSASFKPLSLPRSINGAS